jgi:hypothetical protein
VCSAEDRRKYAEAGRQIDNTYTSFTRPVKPEI